jgi:hypothetical protein
MSVLKGAKDLIIIAGFIVGVYLVGSGTWASITTRWYWMMVIMFVFIMFVGWTVNKRLDGALIDWRKKMSLSHLQVILWTILGMSAFLTIGLTRISIAGAPIKIYKHLETMGHECITGLAEGNVTWEALSKCPAPDPLQIIFPEELLLAMGISLASFTGSALVKSNQSNTTLHTKNDEQELEQQIYKEKQARLSAMGEVEKLNEQIEAWKDKKEIADEEKKVEETQAADQNINYFNDKLKESLQKVDSADKKIATKEAELVKIREDVEKAKGMLHVNDSVKKAKWSDMFNKEKSGEQFDVDLSKIQMFFFTIAIIFTYAASLNILMQQPGLIENPFINVALPTFSSSLVVLLGVSHGGYLVTKSTDLPSTNTNKE